MVTQHGRLTAILLSALLGASCGRPPGPPDRSGFYNLFLSATLRDFANERYYTCEVGFELDVQVPLPDTFVTVADAHIRRSVVWNEGGQVAVDSVITRIPLRRERLRRAEQISAPPDSVQVTLGGAVADTIYGIGIGGSEGRYDGGWSCLAAIPPHISSELQQQGYPAATITSGEWHIFAVYPGD